MPHDKWCKKKPGCRAFEATLFIGEANARLSDGTSICFANRGKVCTPKSKLG
ncbi:MAG: hypothetical protein KAT28_04500 [Candidatus Aenigmarchaeota archaeon]|nr:hypothetical protein [Candidatus Aenigmarchaeota archaeon]